MNVNFPLNRKSAGNFKGEILVNGKPPDKFFKRLSAYVTQDDALPGLLTVRETLKFYADLKLPSTVTSQERNVCLTFKINIYFY